MATAAAALLILTASAGPSVALQCPHRPATRSPTSTFTTGLPRPRPILAPDDAKMTGGTTSNFWHLRAGPEELSINAATAEGPYSRMETIRLPDMVKTCRADFKPAVR
jgi:hypothetical protein